MASHYARMKTTRQYLACGLNVQKMFDLYEEDVVSKDGSMKVDIGTYRRIFKSEYKLSSHRPKKDLCLFCFKYGNADAETKAGMEEEKQRHLENKELARQEKIKDKERAGKEKSFKYFTFDLQSVLYSPCSEVSSYHYSRKFCSYDFTVYDQDTHDGTCYLWYESEGKRGSDEIGTCLWRHMSLPPDVKEVSYYSDCCGGQNRNRFITALFRHAVETLPNLNTVEMNFLESGHTDGSGQYVFSY